MYVEKTKTGKFKFVETYKNFLGETKRISVTLDKNTKQAQFDAYKILQDKITKKLNFVNKKFTVHYCLDMYYDYKKNSIKKSSLKILSTYIKWIKTNIPNVELKTLTTRQIYSIFDEKKNILHLKYFKTFIKWCYERDFIDDIKFLDKVKFKKEQIKNDKLYLEHEEIKDILDFFKNDILIYNIIIILINTGLRIGELLALKYEDIKDGYIDINKTFYKGIIQSPKSKCSIRKIAINNEVINAFKEIEYMQSMKKIISINSIQNNYIFKNRYDKIISYNFICKRIKKYKKINLHFHIFRHTHASLLIEKGINVDTVSRRLGHEDTKITQKIYIHLTEKLKEKEDNIFKNLKII